MSQLTQKRLCAIHEAFHAVMAVNCKFHMLRESVVISSSGHGVSPFSHDAIATRAAAAAGRLDVEEVEKRAALIALSGIAAEVYAHEVFNGTQVAFEDVAESAKGDVELAVQKLCMVSGKLGTIPEQVAFLDQKLRSSPTLWKTILEFSEVLLARGSIDANDATAIIHEIFRKHHPAEG